MISAGDRISHLHKIIPILVLSGHLYFEWCMVRCGSKDGNQNNMYLKEIGLCA